MVVKGRDVESLHSLLLIILLLIAITGSIRSSEALVTEGIEVNVRLEAPLIKYYIDISQRQDLAEFEIMFPNYTAICSPYRDAKVQLVSVSTYLVKVSGASSSMVVCAMSSTIVIHNNTLEAIIPPPLINGNATAIGKIWLPYYIVNISSKPSPIRISILDSEGYTFEFNTIDTIYISARIIPIPGIQQAQVSSGNMYSGLIYSAGLLAAGVLIGGISIKLLPIIRSRIRGRDIEKEIVELLSKNPRGMSLSMISKTLNTPKSSTWKKLRKLVEEGVVEEFEGPGKGKLYRLRRRDKGSELPEPNPSHGQA